MNVEKYYLTGSPKSYIYIMISIAMATYNGETFIREQLDSILAQTEKDIEIVVCDDASSDSTPKILDEYARKDSRIRVFKNQKNLGYRENFNKAVSLCKGEFVAFSDQDDLWLPNHLQVLREAIGDNLVSAGRTVRCTEDGTSLNEFSPTPYQSKKLSSQKDRFIYQCYAFNLYQGASQLISREAIKRFFPIEPSEYAHDWSLATNAIGENRFVYVDTVITKWRKHSSQVTHKSQSRQIRKDRLAQFALYLSTHNECIRKDPAIKEILQKAIEFHTNSGIIYRIKNLCHAWKTSKTIYGRDFGGTLKTVLGYLFTASL
jgi:glycosyltransferase involved in cell wall biosynthesis